METFGNITLHHGDCMDVLRELPDNSFDLAIVDPPYSNGNGKCERTGGTWAAKYGTTIKDWDIAPSDEYFQTLFRISRNQIIWGGQLFFASTYKVFSYLAKNKYRGELYYGYGRICVDFL